jgi:hypothetical protein
MQGHHNDVKELVLRDKRSDSFARHFAQFIPLPIDRAVKLKVQGYIKYTFDILWKGNPLVCVKTFGTRNCSLCKQERLAILKASYNQPKKQINYCNEIYGACRHKPQFHRYRNKHKQAGTDESEKDERVTNHHGPHSSTSQSTIETETSKLEEERQTPAYEDARASLSNFTERKAFFPTSEEEVYGNSSFAPAPDELTLLDPDADEEPVHDLVSVAECSWTEWPGGG